MAAGHTTGIICCRKCGLNKTPDQFYIRKDTGKYRGSCKQCWAKEAKEYREHNAVFIGRMKKDWVYNNPDKRAAIVHRYYLKNKEKVKEYQRYYKRERQSLDARIIANYRGRIWKAIKRGDKSKRTIELLGCSIDKFKAHIESKFVEGMSWSNYGKWHVDHIKPCAGFDLSIPAQQRKCFNYKNTQPLWELENKYKRDKWIISTK